MSHGGGWVSSRDAARVLRGIGLNRDRSSMVLRAGFAGPSVRIGQAICYREEAVEALARRPLIEDAVVDRVAPYGLFIGRRVLDASLPEESRRAAIAGGWEVSVWARCYLRILIAEHGPLPLIGTACGLVAAGAEIVGVRGRPADARPGEAAGITVFELRAPGDWFEALRGGRYPSGPGRPWKLRGWGLTPGPAGSLNDSVFPIVRGDPLRVMGAPSASTD